MGPERESASLVIRSKRLPSPARYGGALLAVCTCLGVWVVSPLMHHDPFAIFVVGVVGIARFLGFGPAVFGTA